MTDARIVLTTVDDLEIAKQLGRELVERRLAACVNIVERIHSIYRWKGRVETADEVQLIIKSSAARIPALKEAIARFHSYELPEILVLHVADGGEEYLAWLRAESDENTKLP